MFTDFILNGQPTGEVAGALSSVGFDPGYMRPYWNEHGRKAVTRRTGKTKLVKNEKGRQVETPVYEEVLVDNLKADGIDSPVYNATSLRKEEWLKVDRAVVKAARKRLRAWSDLSAAVGRGGINGMATPILEYETMSDPGQAVVDMDVLADGKTDSPLFKLEGLPLPITHSDFWFGARRLAISRNTGQPLSTTMAEAAGRRVAETVEQTLIGTLAGVTYGGNSTQVGGYGRTSQVYGYLTFPDRLTKTNLTAPTGSNPEATIADVLAMRDQLYAANRFGPFMLYHSTDWDAYLDNDYARLGGSNANMTLRDRIRRIDGITDVRRLDYLTPAAGHAFTLIMVTMDSETVEAINGMDLTTIQWESHGGMRLNFKVMCIYVPFLKADYNGSCGVLHARTA